MRPLHSSGKWWSPHLAIWSIIKLKHIDKCAAALKKIQANWFYRYATPQRQAFQRRTYQLWSCRPDPPLLAQERGKMGCRHSLCAKICHWEIKHINITYVKIMKLDESIFTKTTRNLYHGMIVLKSRHGLRCRQLPWPLQNVPLLTQSPLNK